MFESEKPRVVVDSLAATSFVRNLLEGEAGMTVVGNALDGKRGLDLVCKLEPDLVVMDIAMPVMNGFTVLREMRKKLPGLPVVIFTSTGEGHAREGLRILSQPHTEWVNKAVKSSAHSSAQEVGEALVQTAHRLMRSVRSSSARAAACSENPPGIAPARQARKRSQGKPFEVLAIGASTCSGPRRVGASTTTTRTADRS